MERPEGHGSHLVRDELDRITTELAGHFPAVSRTEVHEVVERCYLRLAEQATVDRYLPMLAGKAARDELSARAPGV